MPTNLLSRLTETKSLLGKIWHLARPYWFTRDIAEIKLLWLRFRVPERWIASTLLLVIIAASIASVYISKLFNDWYGRFYDALQNKNADAYYHELLYFSVLAFIYIVIAVYQIWLQQLLTIRWRRWLTDVYYRDWLADRTYYRMELTNGGTDNPEQRMQQDVGTFASQTLSITLGLLSNIMTLGTFSVILWGLSGSFTIPVMGGLEIPGYMFWAALLYAVVGSYLTYWVGRPLVRINFMLERYNADFRFQMSRIREHAESVALYGGERDETRRLRGAFGRIYETWWNLMTYNKRLMWLTSFYGQAAVIFPFLVGAPRYLAGQIQLGALMQIVSAFGQVQGSLSWFVNSFADLASWKATVDRLTTFADNMAAAKQAQMTDRGFDLASTGADALTLAGAQVRLPEGRVILKDLDLEIDRGERVVLQGPSGSGKTTLFRVLAGLWPFGNGRVRLPAGARVLFLPQKPYLPLGSLREVLSYPDRPDSHDDDALKEALQVVQLPHLRDRLGEVESWSMTLSPGEQQRLAFARAFLFRPDWIFLDEATSALDETVEALLYRTLRERLPDATVISITHKPSVLQFHDRRIVIDPATQTLRPAALPAPA
jgi:putative ATP-binding cassette transporter